MPRCADFDLTSAAHVARLVRQQRPDVVVHLAGQSGAGSLYNNLTMGAHLIEACHRAGVRKFVQVGRPGNFSHATLFAIAQEYQQNAGFCGLNLVIDDLYGPGDDFGAQTDRLIPCLIRKCLEACQRGDKVVAAAPVRIVRPEQPVREDDAQEELMGHEPLFVRDAARAIELAVASLETARPVHVGTGRLTAWPRLGSAIAHKIGFAGEIRDLPAPPEPDVLGWKRLPGFQAATTLSDGLDATIAWYLNLVGPRQYAVAA